jgi:hypothetical protein
MADLFDTFEHKEILECLKVLGSTSIDNYSEELITKLYDNYAQKTFMAKMYDENHDFFI